MVFGWPGDGRSHRPAMVRVNAFAHRRSCRAAPGERPVCGDDASVTRLSPSPTVRNQPMPRTNQLGRFVRIIDLKTSQRDAWSSSPSLLAESLILRVSELPRDHDYTALRPFPTLPPTAPVAPVPASISRFVFAGDWGTWTRTV